MAGIVPISEAAEHPHIVARGIFVEQRRRAARPRPALLAHRGHPLPAARRAGAHTREALAAWGVDDVDGLIQSGAATQA